MSDLNPSLCTETEAMAKHIQVSEATANQDSMSELSLIMPISSHIDPQKPGHVSG